MTPGFTHKLLAINFGGIGDEILFLPTLRSIRKHYPNWHITLLLEPRSKSVAQVTNLIDATIEFDIKKRPLFVGDLIDLLNLIKSGEYNTVVSSGSSHLVSILLFLSGIEQRVGYKSGWLSECLLTQSVHLNKQQYAANMYHDLVSGLGIKDKASLPQIEIDSKNSEEFSQKLYIDDTTYSATNKRILIHPGTSKLAISKGIIKTWAPEYWVEFILKLLQHQNFDVLLAGGPDDSETIKAIIDKLGNQRLKSAYGLTKNLSDLASLISFSDLLVCVDSAPMHLAVGLNKPLVALFGPTDHTLLLPAVSPFVALQTENNNLQITETKGVHIKPQTVYEVVLNALK